MAERKPALGKGLSALIPDAADALSPPRASLDVDIDLLEPNDYQPRDHDRRRASRGSRATRSRRNGVIQPIIVAHALDRRIAAIRSSPANAAGAPRSARDCTRCRSSSRTSAPDDTKRRLEMALIENIQREDLNPIEEAHAYQRLVTEFGLRHEEIAAAGRQGSIVGREHAAFAAPAATRCAPKSRQGDCRWATRAPSWRWRPKPINDAIARDVLAAEPLGPRDRSDRQEGDDTRRPGQRRARHHKKDVHTRAAEEQLRLALGTGVVIKRRGKGGTLEIAFANEDELQRIYEYLTDRR